MKQSDCDHFRRLNSEGRDRTLTPSEYESLQLHRNRCEPCRQSQQQSAMALNMLRQETIDLEDDPRAGRRLFRKVRVGLARRSIRYWMPAVIGLVAGLVMMLSVLHVVVNPSNLPVVKPIGEARKDDNNSALISIGTTEQP